MTTLWPVYTPEAAVLVLVAILAVLACIAVYDWFRKNTNMKDVAILTGFIGIVLLLWVCSCGSVYIAYRLLSNSW